MTWVTLWNPLCQELEDNKLPVLVEPLSVIDQSIQGASHRDYLQP